MADAQLDDGLAELLADHPLARVSAVTVDGTPVPLPEQVELGSRHVHTGIAGMKAYVPADRPKLMAAFDDARRTGHGVAQVRLLQDPSNVLKVHIFDTSERYGVFLVVGIPAGDGSPAQTASLDQQPVFPSHLARIYKSRTAQILGVDLATTEILGWASADMVGRRSLEFIHEDDQSLAIENWAVLVTDPLASRRVRIRHRASDGRWIWFDVAHSETVWHGEDCFVADMVDLTAEMQAQGALEAREQLLAELTQALPLGVFQIDHDQKIVYTNHRLFDVMGTTTSDTFEELVRWVRADDRRALTAALVEVMRAGGGCELEVHLDAPGRDRHRVCQFTLHQLVSPGSPAYGLVGCVADITERTVLRSELEDKATFDPLTRCYNRATTLAQLDTVLAAGHEVGTNVAVLFIDLDLFKSVNDRYGHHVGDEFLTATAARIRGCLRDDASLGRLGGDEFLVVLPDSTPTEAATVAERIGTTLQRDVAVSIGVIAASASIGIAVSGSTDATAEGLVKQADTAMYEAKRARFRHRPDARAG